MADENYGTVFMGHGEIRKAISLPEELRDGGVIDFGREIPIGWEYDGVLHFFKGKGPQDFPPGWSYTGEMVLSDEEPEESEKLMPPQRAVRILRAFRGELETQLAGDHDFIIIDSVMLASHLAMVCEILADHLDE